MVRNITAPAALVAKAAHTITPKVNAVIAVNVAKRATAALLSIRHGLIFLSILHIAREHISVWVKYTYKDRGALYRRL